MVPMLAMAETAARILLHNIAVAVVVVVVSTAAEAAPAGLGTIRPMELEQVVPVETPALLRLGVSSTVPE